MNLLEQQDKERAKLLYHIWMAIEIWSSTSKVRNNRERCIRLVWSILAMLDGNHQKLPDYQLSVLDEEGNPGIILQELSRYFEQEEPAKKTKEYLGL